MTDRLDLPESLERRVSICARRETVFRYFTDPARFARWWGEGSSIEARPGGGVLIRNPNGVVVRGEVVEIEPPRRIVFTYGYGAAGPTEQSLVTITLEENDRGTELSLHHAFSSARIRDHHVQGWRYQLALFSKVVAEEAHAGAAERVDEFLRAWGEPDGETRRFLLESCATRDVVFHDAFSATAGLDEMLANLDAIQMHMPGIALVRDGDVRQSHGTALARWGAKRENGDLVARGTNLFDLSPDGKIARVVGFWES